MNDYFPEGFRPLIDAIVIAIALGAVIAFFAAVT